MVAATTVMPAINYEEDTEFNDALRKQGILPPKAPSAKSEAPVISVGGTSRPTLEDLDSDDEAALDQLDDLTLEEDDAIPRSVLEAYRAKRVAALKGKERLQQRFGQVLGPIVKKDYTREVTEASAKELDDDEDAQEKEEDQKEKKGTGVVCLLYKDSLPDCKLILPVFHSLAALYPSTKFITIISTDCIPDYPDRNTPTLLLYRKGAMLGGPIVGLGAVKAVAKMREAMVKLGVEEKKMRAKERAEGNAGGVTVDDLEAVLLSTGVLDPHLKLSARNAAYTDPALQSKGNDSDSEADSEDDRRKQRAGIRGRKAKDSDDEGSDWDM